MEECREAPCCYKWCLLGTLEVLGGHSTEEAFCKSFLSHILYRRGNARLIIIYTAHQVLKVG